MVPNWKAVTTLVGLLAFNGYIGTAWSDAGDLLWENRGQSEPLGIGYAIDVGENVVVATGLTGEPRMCVARFYNLCHWYVRAQDAHTGATLWEDGFKAGVTDYGRAVAVTVDAGKVFAAGWLKTATGFSNFVVRAYSAKTGTLLWERREQRGKVTERAYSVVAKDGRVFVAGSLAIGGTAIQEFAVLVLDANTGATAWESETASTTNNFGNNFGHVGAVRLRGDRVFLAGDVTSVAPNLGNSVLVEARDKRTGALLWSDQIADANFFLNTNFWNDLAASDDLVFVAAGIFQPDFNIPWDFMVRAYDARTGALVWMDRVHNQNGGMASRLAVGAGRLFVYGWDCDETLAHCDGDVRAYDSHKGTLLWENRFTGPGGDSLIPAAALALRGSQVFIGTSLLNAQQNQYQWTVRSYNATDGSLRWENQITTDQGFENSPLALKAWGGRLYATGNTERSDNSNDFTVRAYSAPTDVEAED